MDVLSEADRRLCASLREADGGRLLVDERRDGVWVSARSWIGVVRFESWEVRVVPKLAGGNLGVVRMLDYASGISALRRYDALRDLEAVGDSLLELIAWLFADACALLVRDGLLSDYVAREDTLHMLRGRLRTLAQVQRRFGQVDPLEVAFDEFETDIPENRILAAALDATRAIVRNPIVQRPIRRLHTIFREAADPAGFDALNALQDFPYTRRNRHYEESHRLARLLLQRLAVRDLFTPGGTTSFAFLLDMNDLFEAFVSRLTAEVFTPLGIRVHAQRRDPSIIIDEATGKRYSSIIPDLLLERGRGNEPVRLPVDAKYKLYDQKKVQEADVYQTFFYAFAYAPDQSRGPARAVILYPRAGEGSDTALRVDTHNGRKSARIQAFGVDVEGALDAIARGKVGLADVPALTQLHQVFREVEAGVREEAQWRAS